MLSCPRWWMESRNNIHIRPEYGISAMRCAVHEREAGCRVVPRDSAYECSDSTNGVIAPRQRELPGRVTTFGEPSQPGRVGILDAIDLEQVSACYGWKVTLVDPLVALRIILEQIGGGCRSA